MPLTTVVKLLASLAIFIRMETNYFTHVLPEWIQSAKRFAIADLQTAIYAGRRCRVFLVQRLQVGTFRLAPAVIKFLLLLEFIPYEALIYR